GLDVVAAEPVLPGQPAHPAAESEPADAGVRHVPGRGGQPVRLGGPIEGTEQRATLDPSPLAYGVDPGLAHRCQVDHQTGLGHRETQARMPAAPDTNLEILLAPEADRGGDIVRAAAPHNHRWPTVDHRVPHRSCSVVAGISRLEHLAAYVVAKGV